MTELKSSAAIVAANETLAEAEPTVAQLTATLAEVRAEMRVANNTPPAGVSGATSMEERAKMERHDELRMARIEVAAACFRRVNEALGKAQQREAIANADSERADLNAALDEFEEAQRLADKARHKVLALTDRIKESKSAAGQLGKGQVGADAEQIERILELKAVADDAITPEGKVRNTTAGALRLRVEREQARAKAS